jgi:arsenate reductase
MSVSKVVFVCLHGSAKSLVAASYFTRSAREAGLESFGVSHGLEPDAEVPGHVVENMAAKGFDLRGYTPQPLDAAALADADEVVTFGCDVTAFLPPGKAATSWAACPAVSDGFEPAWAFITRSVDGLLERMRAVAR